MSSGDWTEGMAALANSCEARRGLSEGGMGALRLFLAAAALSIGACAATDHFQQRIDRYDLAAAESRDQMIFTNILRASRAEPLSFVQMGQITGSTTAAATVGLPSHHPGTAYSPGHEPREQRPAKRKYFWRQSARRQWLHRQFDDDERFDQLPGHPVGNKGVL